MFLKLTSIANENSVELYLMFLNEPSMLSYQATLVLRSYGYEAQDDCATQTPSFLRLLDLREFAPSCQSQAGNRAQK